MMPDQQIRDMKNGWSTQDVGKQDSAATMNKPTGYMVQGLWEEKRVKKGSDTAIGFNFIYRV